MNTQNQITFGEQVSVDLSDYDRIRAHSPDYVNQRLQIEMETRIRDLGMKGYESISERISELDREWDVDRAAMVIFASLASVVTILGVTKNKKWFALHAIQFPFIAYHAAVGWCPPVSVLRRLGFRSSREIETERCALRQLQASFSV